MVVKTLKKADFKSFVGELIKSGRAAGVKRKGNKFAFGDLSDPSELVLDYDVTVTPPKSYFQPAKEKLLDFQLSPEQKAKPSFSTDPLFLIGVHTYDLRAIDQMDRVWAEKNPDEHYLSRRLATTIIAIEPTKASKWSFWAAVDACSAPKGYDLLLTDLGDSFAVEVGSEKGAMLLAKYAQNARDSSPAELSSRDDIRKRMTSFCKSDRAIRATNAEITTIIRNSYDNPIWAKRAEKCYSCGSCNMVCPTCYCFDVSDKIELDINHGQRDRTWDGCTLEAFAHVGSGENFREHCGDRFRHRIFRKAVYMADRLGELSCVGCGRCSEACLPDITDPVSIINAIKEGR